MRTCPLSELNTMRFEANADEHSPKPSCGPRAQGVSSIKFADNFRSNLNPALTGQARSEPVDDRPAWLSQWHSPLTISRAQNEISQHVSDISLCRCPGLPNNDARPTGIPTHVRPRCVRRTRCRFRVGDASRFADECAFGRLSVATTRSCATPSFQS